MKRKTGAVLSLILILIVLTNLFYPFLFSAADEISSERSSHLSIYSDGWDGLSKFRKELEKGKYDISTIISNPLILREVEHPGHSLYICVGIEKGYDPLQVDAIEDFVNRGGRVLIADDYGDANSLSEEMGVRFTGHRVWSRDYEFNLSFIRVNARVGWNDYTVLLNDPTTLKTLGLVSPLFKEPETFMNTSKESYEDTNDNGKIDSIGDQDTYGELPVGVFVESRGEAGSMVFISDSSFCINDMWDRYDNTAFSLALVRRLLGHQGTVIFDESRHIQSTPIENLVYTLENIYIYMLLETNQLLALIIALGFLNLFGLIYAMTKPPKRFRHKFDLTYKDAFVEQAPDRVADVKNILLTRLKAYYNLYFPDSSFAYAYEPSTKSEYNLTVKRDLQALIKDAELVDFVVHPLRYNIPVRLNAIIMRIDAVFPPKEGAYR